LSRNWVSTGALYLANFLSVEVFIKLGWLLFLPLD
jgi:hypothetical protein